MKRRLKPGDKAIYYLRISRYNRTHLERGRELRDVLKEIGEKFHVQRCYPDCICYKVILDKECETYIHMRFADIMNTPM